MWPRFYRFNSDSGGDDVVANVIQINQLQQWYNWSLPSRFQKQMKHLAAGPYMPWSVPEHFCTYGIYDKRQPLTVFFTSAMLRMHPRSWIPKWATNNHWLLSIWIAYMTSANGCDMLQATFLLKQQIGLGFGKISQDCNFMQCFSDCTQSSLQSQSLFLLYS